MTEHKIKELCNSVPVPDSLSPEQIERRLTEQKKSVRPMKNSYLVAAACLLVLIIGGTLLTQNTGIKSPVKETGKPVSYSSQSLTYEDYYEIIDEYYDDMNDTSFWECIIPDTMQENDISAGAVNDSMTASNAVSDGTSTTSKTQSYDYTETNMQVEGVDEGDIVKTDGTYIYSCTDDATGSTFRIMRADGANTHNVTSFTIDQFSLYEFYVADGRLTAIGEDWSENYEEYDRTAVVVYDISDINSPVFIKKHSQSGEYETSRKNGNYLYTISLMGVNSDYKRHRRQTYIPGIDDSLVPEVNMHRPKDFMSDQYLVITALDVTNPTKYLDSLAILSDGNTYYVSENNIYTVSPDETGSNTNRISKFHYYNGQLDFTCETTVRAAVLNQFSMDEHNGYLRFVGTTYHQSGSTSNGLYILDENLNLIGSVAHLAKGERIYSSRFMGDYAYFVTFRETDPLFAVDLSDPKKPVVLDALKIPGFSEYLHPYGDCLLLGIGQDISDGNERVKLSMFDISSPTDLKELSTHLLRKDSMSLAGDNHKALLVDSARNVIGFATYTYSSEAKYELYRYTEEGFECIASLSPPGMNYETTRGLFVGDYLYLVDSEGIYGAYVYDASTMKQVAKIIY